MSEKKFLKNHNFLLKIHFSLEEGWFLIEQSNAKLQNLHIRKDQPFLHLVQKTVSAGNARKKFAGDLKMIIRSKNSKKKIFRKIEKFSRFLVSIHPFHHNYSFKVVYIIGVRFGSGSKNFRFGRRTIQTKLINVITCKKD